MKRFVRNRSLLTASGILFVGLLVILAGCDSVWGSKSDETTDEIFEAGRSEPGLLEEVNYVPLFPFFERAGDGGSLQSPQDIYVGYDSFIYIVDERGLHVLDRSGRPANFIAIAGGATSVVQDRQFNLYVTARRDTTIGSRTWDLPVVYQVPRCYNRGRQKSKTSSGILLTMTPGSFNCPIHSTQMKEYRLPELLCCITTASMFREPVL